MKGTWLPRVGLACLLTGIFFLLLSGVGLATGEWVWAPCLAAIALLLVAQVLTALGDILSRLQVLEQLIRSQETGSGQHPGGEA